MQIKTFLITIYSLLFLFVLSISSCDNKQEEIEEDVTDNIDTTTLVSTFNSTLSHHTGENCMKCHQKGGNGKAWFTVAGTVYDSSMQQVYPNALLNIYDGINSTANKLARIEVDSLGNYYTTEKLDFAEGFHVEVVGKQIIAGMGSLIRSGECNKCHGVITNRVWTK